MGTQRLRSDGEVLTRGEKVGETVTGPHRVPGSLSMPAVPVLLSFFPQDEEKQKEMRRKARPSFRISHQNGKQVLFSFSRHNPPPPPTHNYIYVHTVTHTCEETRNYRTHQLFIFTSPVESNLAIEKPVVRVQGLLPAVRGKAHSLAGSECRP